MIPDNVDVRNVSVILIAVFSVMDINFINVEIHNFFSYLTELMFLELYGVNISRKSPISCYCYDTMLASREHTEEGAFPHVLTDFIGEHNSQNLDANRSSRETGRIHQRARETSDNRGDEL